MRIRFSFKKLLKMDGFKSSFKTHITNHILLKQSLGYKYELEKDKLKQFDEFVLYKYSNVTNLSKEIVLKWCERRENETQSGQSIRASVIRQFAKYMVSIDIDTYVVPDKYFTRGNKYIPYIYSKEELYKFFREIDRYKGNKYSSMAKIIFRMFYMCGLRLSEVKYLHVQDVDVADGILTINNSKNGKSRFVPMSEELIVLCRDFSNSTHLFSDAQDFFFSVSNKAISSASIYGIFRKTLLKVNIPHMGRGKGPRIHDFRHTFAVNCLRKLSMEKKNLLAYLPILRTYMGHTTFKETAYYLRMTADVYPNIERTLEQNYSGLIPEISEDV